MVPSRSSAVACSSATWSSAFKHTPAPLAGPLAGNNIKRGTDHCSDVRHALYLSGLQRQRDDAHVRTARCICRDVRVSASHSTGSLDTASGTVFDLSLYPSKSRCWLGLCQRNINNRVGDNYVRANALVVIYNAFSIMFTCMCTLTRNRRAFGHALRLGRTSRSSSA